MSKKITKLSRARIYRPANAGALFTTNVITCNKTGSDGTVENIMEANALDAREWVDENQK